MACVSVVIHFIDFIVPDTIKNRELSYELVEKVNAFIYEMESMQDDEVEADDDEELDENELKFEIVEDLHQREREIRSD